MMETRLEVAAVSKSLGGRPVLRQSWLQVRAGEAVGLVGPNGAGKTTLLRVAAGLMRPDSGAVRWSSPVRYFGGEITLPPDVPARRWGAFFGVDVREPRRFSRLSRGTRQSVGLRVVLSRAGAELIVLDEPWEGLDPDGSAWLGDALRSLVRQGAGVLVSSHRLHDLAAACTRFVLLDAGRCQTLTLSDDGAVMGERVAQAFSRGVRRG